MTIVRVVLLLCISLFVSACDNDQDNGTGKSAVVEEQKTPTEAGGVFDPMVSTLDRARAVQGVQDARSADLEAAAEEAGR